MPTIANGCCAKPKCENQPRNSKLGCDLAEATLPGTSVNFGPTSEMLCTLACNPQPPAKPAESLNGPSHGFKAEPDETLGNTRADGCTALRITLVAYRFRRDVGRLVDQPPRQEAITQKAANKNGRGQ